MRLKMYVYLKQANVLSSLGINTEEDDWEEQVVDLYIDKDAIIGFYAMPGNTVINLFTTVDDFRIVYDPETVILLKDIVRDKNSYDV